MSDRPKPGDRLFTTRWVHLFEQDSPEGEVYAPEDGPIPLSRRPRERLELKPDGSAVVFGPGADDRPAPQPARWTEDERRARPTPGLRFAAANRRTIANAARRPAIGLGIDAVGLRDTYDPCQAEENPSAHARRVRGQRSRRTPGARQALPARCEAPHSIGRCASTRSILRYRTGWAASRQSTCRTRSWSAGPIGSLFQIVSDGAPPPLRARGARPRRSQPAPLERTLAISGQRALPSADGLRRLQPDLRSVPEGARPRDRLGHHADRRWAAAAGRAAVRVRGNQCGLQPRGRRPVVRLLLGGRARRRLHAARRPDRHRAQPRHRRARDDARAARWAAIVVHGSVERRRAGVPRGVLGSRRAVPPLHLCGRRRARHPRVARRLRARHAADRSRA